jgi:hypothetical protein
VIFGDALVPARSETAAQWIRASRQGEPGTVGWLVPNDFAAILRLRAPAPIPGDWWDEYRRLFSTVASIGGGYTSTPDETWFAVWEGHGFDSAASAAALGRIPRVELPDRTYYLMQGPLTAIEGLRYPGEDGWRNPDLVWPTDHRWLIATDVDFWSLYVGGDDGFITALASALPTVSQRVELEGPLETED